MSGRAEPVGPEKDSIVKPLEPEGEMEYPPHTFTHITESAEHFDYLVPTGILFSEAPFQHKVSAIWQREGLLGVLRLVYYTALSALGFLKFPADTFELESMEIIEISTDPAMRLIFLQRDSVSKNNPKVLQNVEKVFGEVEKKLEDELDGLEKKATPSQLLHFLLKINQRIRDIEGFKQLPYCEKAASTRKDRLEKLKERVQSILFEGDDFQLVQLYDAIEAEKRTLTFDTQKADTREHHLNYLKNMARKLSEKIGDNFQEAKEELEQSVSQEAKKAHLNLITLQKKLEKTQGLLQKTEGQIEDVKRNMESLTKLPSELNKAKADFQELEESHLEWQKEFATIKESLAQLKRDDERQKELENIEKGNVKKREKGFFWGEEEVVQKLTREEVAELKELQADEWQRTDKIIEFQTQSEKIKTKMLEYSKKEFASAQKKIATLEKQVRNRKTKEREYQAILEKRLSDRARYKKDVEEIKSKLISKYQIATRETQNQTNGIKKYLQSRFISLGLETYNKNQPQMTLHDFLKDSLQIEEKFSQFFKEELSKLSLSVDERLIASYLRSVIS